MSQGQDGTQSLHLVVVCQPEEEGDPVDNMGRLKILFLFSYWLCFRKSVVFHGKLFSTLLNVKYFATCFICFYWTLIGTLHEIFSCIHFFFIAV